MGIEMNDRGPHDIPEVGAVIGSEFAEIAVDVDAKANAPRLRLEDLRTGRVRYLDPLELETIIWLSDGHLTQLLDPSADRWRDRS